MNLVDRVKNICLTPSTEWPVIAGETTATGTLVTGYVLPLAGISAAAGFIGGSFIGQTLPFVGTYRVPIATGLVAAIFGLAMSVVAVFIVSAIINALAPTFGAEKSDTQALKVAVYSATPAWVAGVLQILPALGILAILGALYGVYLCYLGLPRLMKCPQDKAVGYTAVVIVAAIVVSLVVGAVGAMIVGTGAVGTGLLSTLDGGAPDATVDPDSPAGRLQGLADQLEVTGRQIEEAQGRGDANAAAAAAFGGLGALLGGGRRADPVAIQQLQPFTPERFAGLERTSSSAERTGPAGLMVARAEATYGDGADRSVTLEVLDTGGIGALTGLAGWIGFPGEREDDVSVERTEQVGDRLVHEKRSKTGGTNEFAVVLGDRFMVSAKGEGVSADELRAAVSDLGLDRLESMKDEGVGE
jgi:hypothetical protein